MKTMQTGANKFAGVSHIKMTSVVGKDKKDCGPGPIKTGPNKCTGVRWDKKDYTTGSKTGDTLHFSTI